MPHTFDNNLRISGKTSPLTTTYTCGSAATLLVVGIVHGTSKAKRTGGAPTYNSVALVQADETRVSAGDSPTNTELWYLVGPGVSSAYTLSIPNTASDMLYVQISSYAATPGMLSALDVASGNIGVSSSKPAVSVTTTVAGGVIVAVCGAGNPTALTDQNGTNLNRSDNGKFSDSNQYYLQGSYGARNSYWTLFMYGLGYYGSNNYGADA